MNGAECEVVTNKSREARRLTDIIGNYQRDDGGFRPMNTTGSTSFMTATKSKMESS
jgi:hypothetical protein